MVWIDFMVSGDCLSIMFCGIWSEFVVLKTTKNIVLQYLLETDFDW